MNVRIVSSEEIKESPTLCLSPLRYLGRCDQCNHFKREFIYKRKTLEQTLEMSCKPVVSEDRIELLREKEELLRKLKEVESQIKELDDILF